MISAYKLPHEYSRRILLVVIGMTPQIVTETLYKLVVDAATPFLPSELHLLTTREGAQVSLQALLGSDNETGKLQQFCQDYALGNIAFDNNNIHIIADTEGNFIDDTAMTKHNRIAADYITQKICELTSDENCALYVSLAGGRKSMSFYAGYALSLYGRFQDKLLHVVVNKELQNHPDFFYPRPEPEEFNVGDQVFNSRDAKIILAEIAYVRMRYCLTQDLVKGAMGFQATIDLIQESIDPAVVVLTPAKKEIRCHDRLIHFNTSEYALYLCMCERKLAGLNPLVLSDGEFMFEYLDVYGRFLSSFDGRYERAEGIAKSNSLSAHRNFFQNKVSKMHTKIKEVLKEEIAKKYFIQNISESKEGAYEVAVEKGNIEIN